MSIFKSAPHFPAVFVHRDDSYSRCQYCGSIDVADAMNLMTTPGTQFSGSDWKYGWPHKFYFDAINPHADEVVEIGQSYGPEIGADTPGAIKVKNETSDRYYLPIMGTRSHLHLKFYNDHLKEATPEQVAAFSLLTTKVFGIWFQRDEKGVRWVCNAGRIGSRGYQTDGVIGPDGEPMFSEFSPRPS